MTSRFKARVPTFNILVLEIRIDDIRVCGGAIGREVLGHALLSQAKLLFPVRQGEHGILHLTTPTVRKNMGSFI